MCLVGFGCGPRPATVPAPAPRAIAVEPAADDADVELVEEAGPTTALDLVRALPPETIALLLVEDPFATADALGRARLIDHFPEEHAEMVRELRDGTGVDLTDPAGFEAFGLAPHSPAGLAVLRQANGVVPAVLLTVRDRATLRARLLGLERDWLPVERVGTAELFGSASGRAAFVLDRGVALFVDELRPPVRDFARGLVERSALERLDRTEGFQAAMARLPATADVRAFFNPTVILPAELGAVSFVQDLQGIGLAATLRPSGAEGELGVALRGGSALEQVARALRTPEAAALPTERFGAEPPTLALSLHGDPEATEEALAALLGPVRTVLGATVGLDVERDVVPLLSGDTALLIHTSLRAPPPRAATQPWKPVSLDLSLLVGLRDPAAARRLLERLATPAGGGLLRRAGRDFTGTGGVRRMTIGIRGRTLLVSTDDRGLAPLEAKGPDGSAWGWAGAAPAPIDAELGLGGLLLAMDAQTGVSDTGAPTLPPVTAREAAPARAKRREIAKLVAELGRLREVVATRARRRADAGRHLGALRLTLAPVEGGLGGAVTLTPGAATFGDAWIAVADALEDADDGGRDAASQIYDLRYRLEAATQELRQLSGSTP